MGLGSRTSPLNQILFGPPGTGKTYKTIDAALAILDPEFLVSHPEVPGGDWTTQRERRQVLKERFDELMIMGRIRFVTFHQSFSYEDFVEGLRAQSNSENQIEYKVEDGVFKQLCDAARTYATREQYPEISANPRIWKISIDGIGESPTRKYCFDHGEARIGCNNTDQIIDQGRPNYSESDFKKTLHSFAGEIVKGDILLCINSDIEIGAIGVVTGKYRLEGWEGNPPREVKGHYNHVLPVQWICCDMAVSVLSLNDNKGFALETVYQLDRFSWGDLLAHLEKTGGQPELATVASKARQGPHVLIIDEVNRGNISRVFGELITLIEPSKRMGANEALEVVLPYSKKTFSIPSNVYLIGTMNTADRSLAGMDIALRRRFTFLEMPPKPELLTEINIEGVNIGELLRKMNERIEVLLDHDHCLGHAYFMTLKDNSTLENLAFIFCHQILPLLQEYFFEDWERIAWVLNDQCKTREQAFVQKVSVDLAGLFDSNTATNLQNLDSRWVINEKAFNTIESYLGIL